MWFDVMQKILAFRSIRFKISIDKLANSASGCLCHPAGGAIPFRLGMRWSAKGSPFRGSQGERKKKKNLASSFTPMNVSGADVVSPIPSEIIGLGLPRPYCESRQALGREASLGKGKPWGRKALGKVWIRHGFFLAIEGRSVLFC